MFCICMVEHRQSLQVQRGISLQHRGKLDARPIRRLIRQGECGRNRKKCDDDVATQGPQLLS